MKKTINFILVSIIILFSSCQKDTNFDQGANQEKMVDFSITTSLPKFIDANSRTVNNTKSANGGVTNVAQDKYDLRYIMEVWTIGTGTVDAEKVLRKVMTVDNGWANNSAIFDVRLIAQKYNFVFWADFVDQQGSSITEKGLVDLHYNTTSLNNIVFKGEYKVSDDTRDAYFHKGEIDLSVSTKKIAVLLKRPFAKVRFIATGQINSSPVVLPTSSTIVYPNTALFYGAFDAFKGVATGSRTARTGITTIPNKEGDDYVLAFDYILPATNFDRIYPVGINISLSDGSEKPYPSILNIPIVANILTTLKGNFYTVNGIINEY